MRADDYLPLEVALDLKWPVRMASPSRTRQAHFLSNVPGPGPNLCSNAPRRLRISLGSKPALLQRQTAKRTSFCSVERRCPRFSLTLVWVNTVPGVWRRRVTRRLNDFPNCAGDFDGSTTTSMRSKRRNIRARNTSSDDSSDARLTGSNGFDLLNRSRFRMTTACSSGGNSHQGRLARRSASN